MDIQERLEQQLREVTNQFNETEKKRKGLLQEAQNLFMEEIRLQGEYKSLVKLVEDLKEEGVA